MKTLIFILSALFLTKSCSEHKDLKQIEIQYVAETRGYYNSVKIEYQKFYVIHVRNGKPREVFLKKNEWKLLLDLFNNIDIPTFEKLIGPTKEREYDKRPFGNLFITKLGKKIGTRGFDHTIPPKEIKSFVDLILQYSKK